MRSTSILTVAIRNYLEALNAGAQPDAEEAYELEEAVAALGLRLAELADRRDPAGDSQAGANAADEPYVDDDRMPAESQIYPLDR